MIKMNNEKSANYAYLKRKFALFAQLYIYIRYTRAHVHYYIYVLHNKKKVTKIN